jgi:hypothetical protein
MAKKPEFSASEIIYKRVFLLDALPAPLTRADEHWQIFDDYTAWPEFRLRQIRVPQNREWFAAREEIIISEMKTGIKEDISRTILPAGDAGADGPHPEKEIRKNRYFLEDLVIDVFLGNLWGLILAEVSFADEPAMLRFSPPAFATIEVSSHKFFLGENLAAANFEEVKKEFGKIMNSK